MIKLEFVNAQEMARKNPDTFEIPSKEELDSIKKGSIVKVCVNGERFWTEVLAVEGVHIMARIDNDLFQNDISLGDIINFEKKNIYSIYE